MLFAMVIEDERAAGLTGYGGIRPVAELVVWLPITTRAAILRLGLRHHHRLGRRRRCRSRCRGRPCRRRGRCRLEGPPSRPGPSSRGPPSRGLPSRATAVGAVSPSPPPQAATTSASTVTAAKILNKWRSFMPSASLLLSCDLGRACQAVNCHLHTPHTPASTG